jgi:hypothetical protein
VLTHLLEPAQMSSQASSSEELWYSSKKDSVMITHQITVSFEQSMCLGYNFQAFWSRSQVEPVVYAAPTHLIWTSLLFWWKECTPDESGSWQDVGHQHPHMCSKSHRRSVKSLSQLPSSMLYTSSHQHLTAHLDGDPERVSNLMEVFTTTPILVSI